MGKKTAGKINQPPAQADFDKIALAGFCQNVSGVFYRLHSSDPAGNAWPPLHFSKRGNSRFDPKAGVGTLCVGETLAGAMMELFDDHWGPVGSLGRSVTETQLRGTWVTRVSLPDVSLFDATGANLSKIGTDAQLLTGKYMTTRKWATRMMRHPARSMASCFDRATTSIDETLLFSSVLTFCQRSSIRTSKPLSRIRRLAKHFTARFWYMAMRSSSVIIPL